LLSFFPLPPPFSFFSFPLCAEVPGFGARSRRPTPPPTSSLFSFPFFFREGSSPPGTKESQRDGCRGKCQFFLLSPPLSSFPFFLAAAKRNQLRYPEKAAFLLPFFLPPLFLSRLQLARLVCPSRASLIHPSLPPPPPSPSPLPSFFSTGPKRSNRESGGRASDLLHALSLFFFSSFPLPPPFPPPFFFLPPFVKATASHPPGCRAHEIHLGAPAAWSSPLHLFFFSPLFPFPSFRLVVDPRGRVAR